METETTSPAEGSRSGGEISEHRFSLSLSEGQVPPNEVYRFLGNYYIYQDQIGWSRTQTLVFVEAAVLAGAFAREGPLSPILLLLGTVLIHWLFRLIRRDWQVRDRISDSLNAVNRAYSIELIPAPARGVIRGRTLVTRVWSGLVAINLLLALLRTWQLTGLPGGHLVKWWMR